MTDKILYEIKKELRKLSPTPTAVDVVDGNPVKDAIWQTLNYVNDIIDKYISEKESDQMNNLIRVEDAKLYLAKNYIGGKKSLGQCLDEVPTVNAIEILDGATNGDVIQAIFPNAMVYNAGIAMDVEFFEDEEHWFNKDWWNAPYKAESEE